jgi:hypothetical protein
VLENFHCALTFELAGSNYADIFCGLDSVQYRELRNVIIDSILATDMSCHFGLTAELKECVLRFEKSEQTPSAKVDTGGIHDGAASDIITKADRRVIIKTLLHSADISNPCKPWSLSKFWADAVLDEFFTQGDLEKANGYPVSPNMDRNVTNQAELTLNFIDFIVAPLYVGITSLIPAAARCCSFLNKNRAEWDKTFIASIEDKVMDENVKAEVSEPAVIRIPLCLKYICLRFSTISQNNFIVAPCRLSRP